MIFIQGFMISPRNTKIGGSFPYIWRGALRQAITEAIVGMDNLGLSETEILCKFPHDPSLTEREEAPGTAILLVRLLDHHEGYDVPNALKVMAWNIAKSFYGKMGVHQKLRVVIEPVYKYAEILNFSEEAALV